MKRRRFVDRQGAPIEAETANQAGWAVVRARGLKPKPPHPGPDDVSPRVRVFEHCEGPATAEWEWLLLRCDCGHVVLWPTNGSGNVCLYHDAVEEVGPADLLPEAGDAAR